MEKTNKVEVINLDELIASIKNETSKQTRSIISAMDTIYKLNLSTSDVMNKILSVLERLDPHTLEDSPAQEIRSEDIKALIKTIETNFNKIRTNDKGRPLVVRLSDGQNFIKLNCPERQEEQQ